MARLLSVRFLLVAAVCGVVAGCGSTSGVVNVTATHVAGFVYGGQQPVVGSHVALFAASSAGYGSTLTPLATTTTDGSGSFLITSGYSCPENSQAYLVATGGNPGLTGTVDNSAIFLMAALGPCSGASSDTVNIDEVTTVGAAYALSGFVPAGGAGMTESAVTGGGAMAGVATSATNVQGLVDAFGNANNVVNFTTGLAYTATPATGSNGVVPQAVIHALADILQPCVNTSSASSTECAALFSAATPPVTGAVAPVNVFQAALNIAQYPANNVATLFGLLSTTPAFATTLSAAPKDWTVGVAYLSEVAVSESGLGIGNDDTVYVAGSGYLVNFTPQGSPINATNLLTGVDATDALREMAFDAAGNLFLSDGNVTGVYEYSPGGTTTLLNFDVAPVSNTDDNTYGIATDGLGDVWTSSYSKSTCSTVGCSLVEFAKGTSYSPYNTFGGYMVPPPTGAVGGARSVAFDVNTGNVWITAIDDNLGELFTVTPSATGAAGAAAAAKQLTGLGTEAGTPTSNTAYGTISVAVAKNAQAWFVTSGGPAETGSKSTAAVAAQLTPVSPAGVVGTGVTGGGLSTPTQVVVDGNNNLFVANTGANSVVEYNTTAGAFESGAAGFVPVSTDTLHAIYEPSYLEVDRSGALWVESTGSGTSHSAALVQILGVAAPTNPVQSAGQYGVKP